MAVGGGEKSWAGTDPWWLREIPSGGGGFVFSPNGGRLICPTRRILPEPIKIKGARLIVVAITFAVFAVLSIYLVYWYINAALTGQL